MRENWTDSRLDDLNGKVDRIDQRVDRIDQRIDRVDQRIDDLGKHMDVRFDALQRTLFQAAIAMSIAFLTAGAAIAATQI